MRNTQMMKERTLRVLEFTKIRDRLASKAMTDMGRERCEALVPSSNMTEIQRMQAETEEATVILQYVGASPLVPFSDVRASLTLAEKGATLSQKALLEVAALMQSARAARKALDTERDNTPILKELAQRLSTLHNVEQDITNAIISEDEIADRASNELMDIRRHLRGANERIKEKLNQMIRSSAFQKYLQDPIVTMRNDRYCLPVKAEYRGIESCAAAKLFYGGKGSCIFGCMGFGDCARACPQNAICMQDGIACVNHTACIGCGICCRRKSRRMPTSCAKRWRRWRNWTTSSPRGCCPAR